MCYVLFISIIVLSHVIEMSRAFIQSYDRWVKTDGWMDWEKANAHVTSNYKRHRWTYNNGQLYTEWCGDSITSDVHEASHESFQGLREIGL